MNRGARNDWYLRWTAVLLLGAVSLPGADAAAQEDPQPVVKLEFSLSNPGARSLGLGGAFVALADDATAAFANPAGLTQLLDPEISVEARHWRFSTPYAAGGRIEGAPSGMGIDTLPGLRFERSHAAAGGLSFLSYVLPARRGSFAVFMHQLADFHFAGETQGIFHDGINCCQSRFPDQRSSNQLEILTLGVAGALRVSDALSLGLGLSYFDVSLRTDTQTFLYDDDTADAYFARNSYLPRRMLLRQVSAAENTDLGVAAGLLWRSPSGWSAGAIYRQGPEVDLEASVTAGPAFDPAVPAGTELVQVGAHVALPDVWGLGVAYRTPAGDTTLSLEWRRVGYAEILEGLRVDDQVIDDADEVHIGGEYVFAAGNPIVALRLGVWLDPDHQVRAAADNLFLRALLPPGADEIHYAVGLGLAFSSFQLDLAVDLSDLRDTASLSAVYRF